MKPFNSYQYLEGEDMTDRDKKEVGSKFWNKGKWDNFVAPFILPDFTDNTFIDIGCNKGLFLYLAQQERYKRIVGVDSDVEAVEKGTKWRDANGGRYSFLLRKMED